MPSDSDLAELNLSAAELDLLHMALPEHVGIDPAVFRLLFPDFSLSVDDPSQNTCDRIGIDVTLAPGLLAVFSEPTVVEVLVRVYDTYFDDPTLHTVAERQVQLVSTGQTASIVLEFDAGPDVTPGDFTNTVTVVVNPDKKLRERNYDNNTITVTGSCIT
jgi:hypothetical protein